MNLPRKPADPDTQRRDRALEETFPASDPLPAGGPSAPAAPHHVADEDEIEKMLDDALEDTFPASDPPALDDPDHPEPTP